MMFYTTGTAAARFNEARRPATRRPVDTRLVEFAARLVRRSGPGEPRVGLVAAQPMATR